MKFTEIPFKVLKDFFLHEPGMIARVADTIPTLFTITSSILTAPSSGIIDQLGTVSVQSGMDQNFVFYPAVRHDIYDIIIDGNSYRTNPTDFDYDMDDPFPQSILFENVTENHTVDVMYVNQFLLLNFDGEEGATTWIEEAQGLTPLSSVGATISNYITFTESALHLLKGNGHPDVGYITYSIPNVESHMLTFSFNLYVPENADYGNIQFVSEDGLTAIEFAYDIVDNELYFYVMDKEGNTVCEIYHSGVIVNEWINYKVNVLDKNVQMLQNDVEIISGVATIDAPFDDLNYFSCSCDDAYIRNINISDM